MALKMTEGSSSSRVACLGQLLVAAVRAWGEPARGKGSAGPPASKHHVCNTPISFFAGYGGGGLMGHEDLHVGVWGRSGWSGFLLQLCL